MKSTEGDSTRGAAWVFHFVVLNLIIVLMYGCPMLVLRLLGLSTGSAVVWGFCIGNAVFVIVFCSMGLISPQVYVQIFTWIYDGSPVVFRGSDASRELRVNGLDIAQQQVEADAAERQQCSNARIRRQFLIGLAIGTVIEVILISAALLWSSY